MTDSYHLTDLSDEDRLNIERTSHNFYTATGQLMKIPPALYSDLKAGGVSMKYILPDAALEN